MQRASLGLIVTTCFVVLTAATAHAQEGATMAPRPPALANQTAAPAKLTPAEIARVRAVRADEGRLERSPSNVKPYGFVNGWLRPVPRVGFGLELSWWITEYVGLADGDSLRVQFAVKYDF